MLILSCNVGSTSLKYRLYDMAAGERELAWGHFEGVGRDQGAYKQQTAEGARETGDEPAAGYADAIGRMLGFLSESGTLAEGRRPGCVAFKVVAALGYTGVVRLEEEVLAGMEALYALLPAHNPPYVEAIRQFMRLMPGVPLVGSFETGFFQGMPDHAAIYPLPRELFEKGLKRSGAHGASHEYVSGWVTQREGRDDLKIVTCHLGGSSSIAAVRGGRGVDTTIGLSMQTGLPHNNRAGDIDPYLTFYLHDSLGMPLSEIKDMYARQSGLLGLSGGLSADFRDIEKAAREGNLIAKTAFMAFAYQIKKQIGAFAAAMGGLDAVSFTGGIGQNSAALRAEVLSGLNFLGVRLDDDANAKGGAGSLISMPDSPVRVYVVATNEEIVIARKVYDFLKE
ncbi:MAG: acetate/propionate family kinase [Christensenellales bacterium]|jgi:acetate kinase